ncbi:MAG: putative toxin-antitoxin system toxin component, PIN family [Oscillospiraceae bacterium]|nr:putative toxin-antitoxin system toxin component, PIN family [Oscillospiraceae bacterium]
MKILVDSNILISALFYPNSTPSRALIHAAKNHMLFISDYNILELRRISQEKFAKKQADVDLFLAELKYKLISAPDFEQELINDPKDAPILNAAIAANVDIIISGDKHFLCLDFEKPKTIRPADYLKLVGI